MHRCLGRLSLLAALLLLPSPVAAGDSGGVRADRYGDPLPPGAIARLGTVRLRHGDRVHAVAFSPDGKVIATGGTRGQLFLWDVASGKELHAIKGKPDKHFSLVAFAADGKLLAFADRGLASAIHLCDPISGKVIQELAVGKGGLFTLAFSPDSRFLVWAGYKIGYLWDLVAGREVGVLEGVGDSIEFLAFTPDGKQLIVGSKDEDLPNETGAIRIWDPASRKVVRQLKAPAETISYGALSRDGSTLVCLDAEGFFVVQDLAAGKHLRRLGKWDERSPLHAIRFSPDGKILAAVGAARSSQRSEGLVRLWDVATGRELPRLAGLRGGLLAAAFSPDSRLLAVGGKDSAVHLFDLATGKERFQDRGLLGGVTQVVFAPDGRSVATGSWDGIRLWDAGGMELPQPRRRHEAVSALAFSGDGKGLIYAGVDGTLRRLNVVTGDELRRIPEPAPDWWWHSIVVLPEGKTLAAGCANECVLVQDVDTGKTLWQRTWQEEVPFLTLALTRQNLAAGGDRGSIFLWDLAIQKLRWHTPGGGMIYRQGEGTIGCHDYVEHLAFSPDGKTLASSRQKDGLRYWEVATGKERFRLSHPAKDVAHIAFAPHGRLVATGGEAGTVALWDALTGERLLHERGHRGSVDQLAFSPEGRLLVSGSSDSTALIWNLSRVAQIRGLPARNLTATDLDALWLDLAGTDGPRAYLAIHTLAAAGDPAARWLGRRLRPVRAPVTKEQILRLMDDLDSDQYGAREKASAELARLGEWAGPHLRERLRCKPSPEFSRRAEQLLQEADARRLQAPEPETLRALRAVEALEWMGCPAAKEVLQALATGAAEAQLTQECSASLDRLRRAVPKP
jgi:WD40 repeat protein